MINRFTRPAIRLFSTGTIPLDASEGERILYTKLIDSLQPSAVIVKDISGGCGSMYAVQITSSKFKGVPLVKQHQMVNQVLKDDIKGFHGIQIKTKSE